jgi:hypothetical protein
MKIKITFQNDSNGRGWNVWCGPNREWQPIVGYEDREPVPSLADACDADPCTYFDPDRCDGIEII